MPAKKKSSHESSLASEVGRLARATEQQNVFWRRFLSGILFGIGTAIGASFIAALTIILLTRVLAALGIDNPF